MDLDSAREDLLVAGIAAAGAVGLTLTLEVAAGVDVPLVLRAAPIGVYLLYLFTRKGGPYGPLDTPRNWAILAGLITLAAGAYAMIA